MASIINADTGVVSGITGIVQTADATGNLVLQSNGNTVLTIDTSLNANFAGTASAVGNITGGNILTSGIMSSTGNVTAGNVLISGIISATGNGTFGNISATTITETSSLAFKENIRPLTNPLVSISQLEGVIYDRRDGSHCNEIGLIAEEVYKTIPELVTLDEHGKPYGIQYTKLTAYLVECIKDLNNQIAELKKGQ